MNTRRERAQDLDSDSSLDSSDNGDDGSNQESLNSELSQEAQWQAEMDYYDFVMARGRAIAECRRQEEFEDNDIQSDGLLSKLGSSLFDGMDIEGIESGDVEMGGTAGITSLANQDDQGKEGQGDSLEDVGSSISTRMTIQGAGISPRRTRSGKVVLGGREQLRVSGWYFSHYNQLGQYFSPKFFFGWYRSHLPLIIIYRWFYWVNESHMTQIVYKTWSTSRASTFLHLQEAHCHAVLALF